MEAAREFVVLGAAAYHEVALHGACRSGKCLLLFGGGAAVRGVAHRAPRRPLLSAMAQAVAMAQPVAQPQMQVMSVQVPQGVGPGQMIQVQTPAGLMQVAVPQGVMPGQTFQMQVPAAAAPPMAQPMAQPAMQQPMYGQQPMMQQQPMYQQQPQVVMQQQPQVVVQQAPTTVIHTGGGYGGG